MGEEHLTRNLTVLFGFFFVILSSLLAATASAPPTSNGPSLIGVVLYFIGVLVGIGCTLVGIEIWMRFEKDGLKSAGKWGLSWLIVLVPFLYNILLALLVGLDQFWFTIGISLYIFLVQMPYLYSYFKQEHKDRDNEE